MKESNVPEYYKVDIPFNPDVDARVLSENIHREIRRHFPLWEDGDVSISVALVNTEHMHRILYGPKKRSDFNMFAGLRISCIIRMVYHTLTGIELTTFSNGWGHKKDGSSYYYSELYFQED